MSDTVEIPEGFEFEVFSWDWKESGIDQLVRLERAAHWLDSQDKTPWVTPMNMNNDSFYLVLSTQELTEDFIEIQDEVNEERFGRESYFEVPDDFVTPTDRYTSAVAQIQASLGVIYGSWGDLTPVKPLDYRGPLPS